jgi:YidC/Oxa1 family membrane protein insertase
VSTEKRVFLAIFLSFGLLTVYQTYFAPPAPVTPAANGAAQTTTAGAPVAPVTASAQQVPALTVTPDASARDIVVETDSVRAVFTTQGATLKSWQLLKYKGRDGKPLELIPTDLPSNTVPAVHTDHRRRQTDGGAGRGRVRTEHRSLTLGAEPGTLTFQLRGADGVNARKTFYFQPERQPYVLNTEFSVDQAGSPKPFTINFGPAVAPGYSDGRTVTQAIHYLDGSVTRVTAANVATQSRHEGAIRYVGVEDHYFLAAALPASEKSQTDYTL